MFGTSPAKRFSASQIPLKVKEFDIPIGSSLIDVLLADRNFPEVDRLLKEDPASVLNQLMNPATFQLAIASGYFKASPSTLDALISADPKALGSICFANPKV